MCYSRPVFNNYLKAAVRRAGLGPERSSESEEGNVYSCVFGFEAMAFDVGVVENGEVSEGLSSCERGPVMEVPSSKAARVRDGLTLTRSRSEFRRRERLRGQ